MQLLRYVLGKFFQKIQFATLRNCSIDKTAKVCQRSNLINVSMGRYSYMGAANSLNNVQIGSFCSIASNCAIGGGDHPTSYVSTSPIFLNGNNVFNKHYARFPFVEDSPVIIGNDVWIGEGCFICGGVTIGDGAVVGAHSVVTKDVEPYSIVAGAPARLLRYRFDKKTIEKLIDSQWWSMPDSELERVSMFFHNPDEFLAVISERSGS